MKSKLLYDDVRIHIIGPSYCSLNGKDSTPVDIPEISAQNGVVYHGMFASKM